MENVENTDLVIKQEELASLDSIVGRIPTMYGLPLVRFFEAVNQKRAQEKQAAVQEGSIKSAAAQELAQRDVKDLPKINEAPETEVQSEAKQPDPGPAE